MCDKVGESKTGSVHVLVNAGVSAFLLVCSFVYLCMWVCVQTYVLILVCVYAWVFVCVKIHSKYKRVREKETKWKRKENRENEGKRKREKNKRIKGTETKHTTDQKPITKPPPCSSIQPLTLTLELTLYTVNGTEIFASQTPPLQPLGYLVRPAPSIWSKQPQNMGWGLLELSTVEVDGGEPNG